MRALTDVAVADVAHSVGFTGPGLVLAVAVALGESGTAFPDGHVYVDADAHNAVPPDDSWGPWQINTIGDLWPERAAHLHLTAREQLTDPRICAAAAWWLSAGGLDWRPWSAWTEGRFRPFMGRAQLAAAHLSGSPGGLQTFVLHRFLQWQAPIQTGGDVVALQRVVGAAQDGELGPRTSHDLKVWQSGHRLTAEGVVGPLTAAAMGWGFVVAGQR